MASILDQLDREWDELASSPRARCAVRRWASAHSALAGNRDLAEILAARRVSARAPAILEALAVLAPRDELAARTLLQALLPGLVCLASRSGNDDPAAIDELVSLAWERIRTYPTTRHGSVAANVLLDTRKRYRKHRVIEAPRSSMSIIDEPVDGACQPEDEVAGRLLIEELCGAERAGVVSSSVLALILRTRLGGERLVDVAAEQDVAPQILGQQRWRAERRLRRLPLAG
jgi:hypothetical protein